MEKEKKENKKPGMLDAFFDRCREDFLAGSNNYIESKKDVPKETVLENKFRRIKEIINE